MADQQRHQTIGRPFGTGKVQRLNRCTVQQSRNPYPLTVWLVEYKIAVQVAHSDSAGKVRVVDLLKLICQAVVDIAGAVASNKQLSAVVRHADRTGRTGYSAQYNWSKQRVEFVQHVAGHNIPVTVELPHAANWPIAHVCQQAQAGGAVKKRRFFATLGNNFGEQIDHAAVSSVDTAGHI